jgi:hypothetical protein
MAINITGSGNLGALALDATGYRLWPAIRGNIKYAWEWLVNSDEASDTVTLVKNALRGRTLAAQLREAAFFGLGLIIIGELIGRYGFALQPADILKHSFWNTVAGEMRDFGRIVRAIGTLYAAFWLGIIVAKSEAVIAGLSFASKAFDKAREFLAVLSPNFLGLEAILTKGQVFSKERGEKDKNKFLALFIWIITFGVSTQFEGLIPLDASIGKFLTFICILIVLYAISTYLGTDHIKVATWVNIVALAYLVLSLFFTSFVYATIDHWYAGTDFHRSSALPEAATRVLNGTEEPGDAKLLGLAYGDVVAVRDYNMGTDRSPCARQTAAAHMRRAEAVRKGEVSNAVFPDCAAIAAAEAAKAAEAKAVKDQAAARREAMGRVLSNGEKKGDKEILDGIYLNAVEARKLEARTNNDECHQARLVALHKRIKLFKEDKDFDGVVLTPCQTAVSNPPSVPNPLPPSTNTNAGNKVAPGSAPKPAANPVVNQPAQRYGIQ